MTIERMHFNIKLQYNKLNTNHNQDLPPAYIDDVLNMVISDIVEIFYSGENHYGTNLGYEVTQQMMDYLNVLTVQASFLNQNIITLPTAYRHFINGTHTTVPCPECNVNINVVRHNDLNLKMIDEHHKPSLKWKRSLGVFKGNTLTIYSEHPVQLVTLTYLKHPVKVFIGGYNSLEYISGDTTAYSSTTPKVDCDLPESVHNLVVSLAVTKLAEIMGDLQKAQIFENRFIKTQ